MSMGLRGQSGCCGCRKLTKEAHLRGPREGYLVDLWVRGDCCSHCGPKAWHDVHHTRREPDLGGTEMASKDQMGSASCSCRPIRRGGESCSPVMSPKQSSILKGKLGHALARTHLHWQRTPLPIPHPNPLLQAGNANLKVLR